MRGPSQGTICNAVAALLWGLAIHNAWASRALFWDGASFLVNLLDHGRFHDFYAARAHVERHLEKGQLASSVSRHNGPRHEVTA